MVEFTQIDKAAGPEFEKTLFRKDIIPVFGENTEALSRAYLGMVNRYFERKGVNPRSYEDSKELVRNYLEHSAILGAIVANLGLNGNIYDFGCGVSTTSIAYALLTGKKITAVDCNKKEIEESKRLTDLTNTSNLVELVHDTAENVVSQKGLKPNDVVIISEPDGTLANYWRDMIKDHKVSLILNQAFSSRSSWMNYILPPHMHRESIQEYATDYIAKKGYNVRICEARFTNELFTFIARPN